MKNDLTGKRFGNLTVIRNIGKDKHGNRLWECSCDCGNKSSVYRAKDLNIGKYKSCGCLSKRQLKKEYNLKNNLCSVEGCCNVHYGLGYCLKHYTEYKRHGEIRTNEEKSNYLSAARKELAKNRKKKDSKKCDYCDKNGYYSEKFNRILCSRHYAQMKKHGEIRKTRQDMKDIVINDDNLTAYIILRDKNLKERDRVLVDIESLNFLKDYNWYLNSWGYAERSTQDGCVLMHRKLVNCPKGLYVDHINRNKLDCRLSNLRICTQHENNMNTSIRPSKYGMRGVYKNEDSDKWIAHIGFNNKKIHIGCFNTKKEAILERKKKEKELFDEFAPID